MSNHQSGEKKIFIVTSGCYSDYSIYGVFSTRKKAQELIDRVRSFKDEDGYSLLYWAADADIEEWPLDELLSHTRQTYWSCGIRMDNGAIVESHGNPRQTFERPFRSEVTQHAVSIPAYGGEKVSRVRSTVSMEHAIKVAAEDRQKFLRESAAKAGTR
jgi:hypothetical protein